MILNQEKLSLMTVPTPLDYLANVSGETGVNIYLKRDDLTNYGTGGNKLRKLEYLLKDALDQGATMILTVGGAQTNHGRLTAAVAAKYNLKCGIIAVDPYPGELSANLLLDGIMGCHVYLVQRDGIHSSRELQEQAIEKVKKEWEGKGEKIYFIPAGGSDVKSIAGYYECALELNRQMKELGLLRSHLLTTVGSMGTYMGLALGIKDNDLPIDLTGVCIFPYRNGIMPRLMDYYREIEEYFHFGLNLEEKDFKVTEDYTYGGYNNCVKEVREAIYYLARKEGILTDPCYTGKTLKAALSMIEKGEIHKGENLILHHTGGFPGLYTKHHRLAFEEELQSYVKIL